MKTVGKRFCKEPFTFLYIGDGGTSHLCCPSWLKDQLSVGNVFEAESLDEIWNSPNAKLLRESVAGGDFRYCNAYCPHLAVDSLPQIAGCDPEWRDLLANPTRNLARLPRKLQFSYDYTCNLRCSSCRNDYYHLEEPRQGQYAKAKEAILKPLLKDAELLLLSGAGEALASRHSLELIDELKPKRYPRLRYFLQTNGILFTKELWERRPHLQAMIHTLSVSIDAASKPTYEAIRRGAAWETLVRNLEFIGTLRLGGRIQELQMRFVVQRANFREMVEFARFGLALGADAIPFSRIENWGIFRPEDFVHVDVCHPSHPEHGALVAVLEDPVFDDPRVWLGNLSGLRPSRA
jgi:MoaA/NifB/PqqE/SkfB family radical SAM enzyme